jgi:hypothetical protein
MSDETGDVKSPRQRLRDRSFELKNSELWNFKKYYEAAKWTGRVGIALDVFTAIVGGLLLYLLTRSPSAEPQTIDIGVLSLTQSDVSIMLLVFSFINVFWKPGTKSLEYHRAGQTHQELFDKISDFIQLELEGEDKEISDLRSQYDSLVVQRHELKDSNPQLDGIWYQILKRYEDKVYEQAATTEDDIDRLS